MPFQLTNNLHYASFIKQGLHIISLLVNLNIGGNDMYILSTIVMAILAIALVAVPIIILMTDEDKWDS